eukprot:scaffold891_cov130-Skeletonema_menzelii.AAC.3
MSLRRIGETSEPAAAMWRGVRPNSSHAATISGHILIMLPTISNGGLSLAMKCRSVMPFRLSSENNEMDQAKLKKQSGLENAMSVRIICQSLDLTSPSRMATGFSTVELDIVILLIMLLLLAICCWVFVSNNAIATEREGLLLLTLFPDVNVARINKKRICDLLLTGPR